MEQLQKRSIICVSQRHGGTGLPRILNRRLEYGLPTPLFEEFGNGFKVTLFRKENTQDAHKAEIERIVELIRQYRKITTKDIAQDLGVSVSTVKRRLKSIPNVSYIGSGFSGHWEIRETPNEI